MYDIIKKKRDGYRLTTNEIQFALHGYVREEIKHYEMSALLMAVYFQSLSAEELADWTRTMIDSGQILNLPAGAIYVDKHSTGGVGDKVSLPLAPLVASLGGKVPMLSGRALGHTGGTLDKLESIPGFRVDLSANEFIDIVQSVGCCITGQTEALVPADRKLYALRDVTASVDSIPLIASSILSKKKAAGVVGLVMDVKYGSGAFMKSEAQALKLAQTLVQLGNLLDMKVTAYVTNMDQPLGRMVGNALEVIEAIEVLKNQGPNDTKALVVEFAAQMLVLANLFSDMQQAKKECQNALDSGIALQKFAEMVEAQKGDPRIVTDYTLLPIAPCVHEIRAETDGFVSKMDTEKLGMAVLELGAGRKTISDAVDHSVGIEFLRKTGEKVQKGEVLARVYYNDTQKLKQALAIIESGFTVQSDRMQPQPLILLKV